MAISLIVGNNTGSSNGSSVTTSAIDTSGANFIVVSVVHVFDTGGPLNDNKSNTWTALTDQGAGGFGSMQLFYCASPTVGSGHTFSWSSGFLPAIGVAAFSGVNTTPFDVENGTHAFGTTLQPGTITPNQNNSLVFTGYTARGGSGYSIDGGFTIIGTPIDGNDVSTSGSAIAYLIQTTAAAANPTWTIASGNEQGAAIAAFKPGGGGPPVVTPTTSTFMLTGI